MTRDDGPPGWRDALSSPATLAEAANPALQQLGGLASFDYITTFDVIHDQTQPAKVLANIYALLKPGGFYSLVDVGMSSELAENLAHPMGAFVYNISLFHCMPIALCDGGAGLGTAWGKRKAVEMVQAAGFPAPTALPFGGTGLNVEFRCHKPAE